MDILKYKGYDGTAELDMSRGVCRGKILFIKDLVTYESDIPAQLQKEFEAAVDDYLETCEELGIQPGKPLRGQFNVRVSPDLHRAASLRALEDGIFLNDVVVKALDAFLCVATEVNNHYHVRILSSESLVSVASGAGQQTHWDESYVH